MLTITIHAPGNPDYQQYAPIAPSKTFQAGDLAGISDAARWYIRAYDLGGGNFAPEPIRNERGEEVGRVSYNGHVWPPGQWSINATPIYIPD
jgi:hypothetical protein